jgi:hypothetical protein
MNQGPPLAPEVLLDGNDNSSSLFCFFFCSFSRPTVEVVESWKKGQEERFLLLKLLHLNMASPQPWNNNAYRSFWSTHCRKYLVVLLLQISQLLPVQAESQPAPPEQPSSLDDKKNACSSANTPAT